MAGATATMRQEWVDRHYSQEQLKDKRRNFLRSCRYAVFRQLVWSGELTNTLRRKRMSAVSTLSQWSTRAPFTNRCGREPRGCAFSTATSARGQGEWRMRPPSEYSQTPIQR